MADNAGRSAFQGVMVATVATVPQPAGGPQPRAASVDLTEILGVERKRMLDAAIVRAYRALSRGGKILVEIDVASDGVCIGMHAAPRERVW